ncbi:hypothetical protein JCM10207_003946 [Rhodosporidiobolus poonsookiae]
MSETEDDYAPRRVSTPLGRLDSQRADFPSTSSASSTPYGSPANPPILSLSAAADRARRPAPKSAGTALLPSKPIDLKRAESWERDATAGTGAGRGRSASLVRLEITRREGEGPFSDPLRSDWGTASTSDSASLPPLSPEIDPRRRGSAVSTSSALSSYYPHSNPFSSIRHAAASSINTNRQSVSSFGGATINTVGSGFPPLVQQPTTDSYSASAGASSRPPSVDGRPRAATGASASASTSSGAGFRRPSSAYSLSDNGSVHSYPPRPRQRTRSTTGSSENGEAGGHGWAREFATGQIKREGSGDSRSDFWPPFVTASYVHSPVPKPAPTYQSSLSTYSFPAPSTRTPHPHSSPPSPVNPLAPLRKRLARSLASSNNGRRLHTEVQLLFELIDALEHCITSFSHAGAEGVDRSSGDSNASSSAGLPISSLSASTSSFVSVSDDVSARSLSASVASSGTGTPTGPAPPRSQQPRSALTDEVRLLVRELAELVPDVQRCLTSGQYGPLARPGAGTGALLRALDAASDGERAAPDWWPRRLARDCRALLEEAGLPIGTASTAWLLAASEAGAGGGNAAGAGADGAQANGAPPFFPPGMFLPAFSSRFRDDAASESRQEELLMQGKKRWETFRQRQSALEQFSEGPTQ